jgi:opacity protein-like surface antigen
MKKTALLLGSLLVVGATASAKEVAPAPVVQQEPQVVEVVVIKEAPKVWKPNGTFKQELEYHGNYEGKKNRDYLRYVPAVGNINITPNLSADFRLRYQLGLHEGDSRTSKSEFRTRWYYDHGTLADTKIDMKSRFRFQKTTKFQAGYNYNTTDLVAYDLGLNYTLEYRLGFNFKDYIPSNDYFKVTNFTLAPSYAYMFAEGDSQYANMIGLEFLSTYDLPWGFSAELNLYNLGLFSSVERVTGLNQSNKNFYTFGLEAYLYYNYKLLESQDGRTSLSFLFEGGFDPYQAASKRIYGIKLNEAKQVVRGGDRTDYFLYAQPELRVTHKATPDVSVYAGIKGYYGNEITTGSQAKLWRWQPRAVIGWSAKF